MTSTVCVISCQKREKEKHGSFSQGQGKVPGRWSELCCNVTASHDLHFLHGLMSKEEGEQAWLLLTRARQSPGSLCRKVVRAGGHLPVPEAGLQHPGSVARLQEDRRPLVPVLTLDLVLPPDAAAVLGYPLLRPVWESCTATVVLKLPCAHTLRMQQASDSHIVFVLGSLHV